MATAQDAPRGWIGFRFCHYEPPSQEAGTKLKLTVRRGVDRLELEVEVPNRPDSAGFLAALRPFRLPHDSLGRKGATAPPDESERKLP